VESGWAFSGIGPLISGEGYSLPFTGAVLETSVFFAGTTSFFTSVFLASGAIFF
jgi:hypothetical protein